MENQNQNIDLESIARRLESGGVKVERIKVREGQTFTLTARELRSACAKFPHHPHADIFRNAVLGHGDDEEVHVDRVDLEALLQNKRVIVQPEQSEEVLASTPTLVTTERKVLAD